MRRPGTRMEMSPFAGLQEAAQQEFQHGGSKDMNLGGIDYEIVIAVTVFFDARSRNLHSHRACF